MELMETTVLNKEEELYLSLVYYRLKKDLEIINEQMDNNSPKDYTNEQNVFKREWGKNVVNPVKRGIVRDLSGNKKKAMDNIDAFEAKHGTSYLHTEEELKAMADEFFKDDTLNEARILLSLRITMADDYEFVHPKKCLRCVSLVLFGAEEKMNDLFEELKNNYLKINKQDFYNVEKGVFIGLGIATAATLIAGPIGLTAAACTSPNVAQCLANLATAGAGVYGPGVALVTYALVASDVLLIGATAGVLSLVEIRKNKELKKEFRSISSESLAMKLAIKATLIEEIRKNTLGDEVLSYIDDALHVLDDYRADAEYMMIVEKLDAKNAKKKISVCNNLSARLAEIVGI